MITRQQMNKIAITKGDK